MGGDRRVVTVEGGQRVELQILPAVPESRSPSESLSHPESATLTLSLTLSWTSFHKTEPLIAAREMPPSEYIKRRVRFSLFPHEDAGWLIDHVGSSLFMFASDYPHPEGSHDPIKHFQRSLDAAGVDAITLDRFYSGNFAELMRM